MCKVVWIIKLLDVVKRSGLDISTVLMDDSVTFLKFSFKQSRKLKIILSRRSEVCK